MNKKELLESLKREGFSDKIVNAFDKVEREDFVPENLKEYAYEDAALPLEKGATISQPYTIAFMLNLLELEKAKNKLKILEIGSGSGYVLALLSDITDGKIFGIEIIKPLANRSKIVLSNLKYKNIEVINKSGFDGLPEKAPFDRILVSAAANEIPEKILWQLNNNGIMVAPVKESIFQIRKKRHGIETKEFPGFVFVPLVK